MTSPLLVELVAFGWCESAAHAVDALDPVAGFFFQRLVEAGLADWAAAAQLAWGVPCFGMPGVLEPCFGVVVEAGGVFPPNECGDGHRCFPFAGEGWTFESMSAISSCSWWRNSLR